MASEQTLNGNPGSKLLLGILCEVQSTNITALTLGLGNEPVLISQC